MSFRTLFTCGYDAFLDENRDAGDLWFFLHIPKTAGSSFRAEIATILKPDFNVSAYGENPDLDHGARLDAAVVRFAKALWTKPARFASGHIPRRMMTPITTGARPPKVFTMLRDPVARVISDFRYQGTALHPDHAAFRARCPDIDRYLDVPGECDKMMHYLAPAPDASVAETIDHILDTFVFVGSMETYAQSFRLMMALLGHQCTPSMVLRQTEHTQAVRVDRTPALEQRIRAANARDMALYDALMAKLRTIEDSMEQSPADLQRAPFRGFRAWRTL